MRLDGPCLLTHTHTHTYIHATQVELKDLGSTNGFFVNGYKKAIALLAEGDLVTFGGGGGDLADGSFVEKINSDCVYTFHAAA